MPPQTKEWTLMFYFASDNPLAPSIVSQLKAIKQAGYHPEANVIAQFDPQTAGTPTHVFDVNLVEKLKSRGEANIGFGSNDPFVRKLMDDKLWRDQKDRDGKFIKERIRETLNGSLAEGFAYDPPEPPPDRNGREPGASGEPTELGPKKSLGKFLKFCSDNYPARHYMLFILGHGLVVGNDVFLFDEHADEPSLSLLGLGEVISEFKREVDKQGSAFELIGFHSCSVSSLEVAYELQGTANYMLASQGPAFVGSWPYRQILIRIFNDLEELRVNGRKVDVKEMLGKIFSYCLHNSGDFMLAGYSFDLCLCNLDKVAEIKKPLEELADTLVYGLANPLIRDAIVLAHWKAQSFWQESYTDLFDFCLCLSNHCNEYERATGEMSETMTNIYRACGEVMARLEKERPRSDDDNFIVRAEFAGPAYQYSHGQSVFFPWAEPSSDSPIMESYRRYRFRETSWHTFLEKYFAETLRETRKSEAAAAAASASRADSPAPVSEEEQSRENLLEDMASLIYNQEGQLSMENTLANPPALPSGKVNPRDLTGEGCACSTVKNYPRDTRARRERGKQVDRKFIPVSDTFFTKAY
jgi:hypothetical protein